MNGDRSGGPEVWLAFRSKRELGGRIRTFEWGIQSSIRPPIAVRQVVAFRPNLRSDNRSGTVEFYRRAPSSAAPMGTNMGTAGHGQGSSLAPAPRFPSALGCWGSDGSPSGA
jgi:hypothetical protein